MSEDLSQSSNESDPPQESIISTTVDPIQITFVEKWENYWLVPGASLLGSVWYGSSHSDSPPLLRWPSPRF